MKVTRISPDTLALRLGMREKDLLVGLLDMYPRVPSGHQRLSASSTVPDQESCQRLLDEALAEQRAENKRHWRALLSDQARLIRENRGYRLLLSDAHLEWLLQILNDIRVGSWLALGAPEALSEIRDARNALDVWAMEMSGHLQMQLLAAVEGCDDAGEAPE